MVHYNGTTESFRGFSLVIRSFSDVWLVDASTDVIYMSSDYRCLLRMKLRTVVSDACHQSISNTTV